MHQIKLGGVGPSVSELALGCMRLCNLDTKAAESLLRTAMDQGINFFDHADIYGKGGSESLFASALGMAPSLDTLMEPEEVAEAFAALRQSGKVRYFGVSNQNAAQMALLQSALGEKLLVNQLQFGLAHTGIIDAGFNVNMKNEAGLLRDGGILEYCRLNGITIQAWSPLQYGFFGGVFLDNPAYPELNSALEEIAREKQVSKSAVAISWILRHPANIQPILGTTSREHLLEMCRASDITLSRAEWYGLYRTAGNRLP